MKKYLRDYLKNVDFPKMAGPLRWGVISTGKISTDFVNAVQVLGSDKHVFTAVAARSMDSAKKFGNKFGIPKCYDQYEALGKDPEIDVVYIGSITSAHLKMGKDILSAGKPVICEKTLCLNLKDTQELIDCAKKNNVFFMEAMWARCNPVYRELQARIERKEIGEVTHVHLTFGVTIAEVNRVYKKEIGGGLLLDFGIYPLNLILQTMGDEKPKEIKTMARINEFGCEAEVTGTMRFSKDRFGTFALSSTTNLPNDAYISGTKGTIKLSAPFWSSNVLSGPSGDFKVDMVKPQSTFWYPNSEMLKYEAEEVAKCLQKGLKESPLVPHRLSLLYAELLEQMARDNGVQY